MTKEQMNRCKDIIHTRAVLAAGAGAGLAQIPGSDSLVIVPIQAEMLKEIGKVFDCNITEQCVTALLGDRFGYCRRPKDITGSYRLDSGMGKRD